ncbi:MAG: tRNA lysidine(34) synthetase TilS [Firmicutes bacterium]|nr:tRNA lysidine(34) synthetase TilS [Bacillota bacterium]
MSVVQDVLLTIKKYNMIESGNRVLVAVSGGPDSMALLHILFGLKDQLGIQLHVFHLNHCFRGTESMQDACLVEDTAQLLGVPYTLEKFDVPAYCVQNHKSNQEGAREVRYNLISRISSQIGAARVALGHHADDQAETVIANFLRGSGLTGLKGFLPLREEFYIRPLFRLRRKDIEEYCKVNKISYRIDSSNKKTVYKRNQIRLELIPVLEDYNPALVNTLLKTAEVLRAEDEFLENEAGKVCTSPMVSNECNGWVLDIDLLTALPLALQRRVMRKLWSRMVGEPGGLGFGHLEVILDLLQEGKGSWESHLPRGIHVTRSYNQLYFKKESESNERAPVDRYHINVPGETQIPGLGVVVRANVLFRGETLDPEMLPAQEVLLDYDKLNGKLFVRTRLHGDRFSPLGMNGAEVKLKKFFIDQKIPWEKRESIPLVTCNGEIAWVAGVRPAEKFKVDEASERLLHLSLLKQ